MFRFSSSVFLKALFMSVFFCGIASQVSAVSSTGLTPLIPNDPYWDRQWYARQIHLPEAWSLSAGARPVTIAVIDAGVDVTHPDLRQNIWVNPGEIPGDGIDNDANG